MTTWSEVSCEMGEFLSLEVTILPSSRRVYILFLVCDYPAKFGNHRHCKRGDARLSFWHVTSRDDIVKGSCHHEFPSSQVTTLPSLVAIGLPEKEEIFCF